MARAILFDLDGTVWDSWQWYAKLLCDRGAGPVDEQLALIKGGQPAAILFRKAGLSTAQFNGACTLDAPPLYEGVAATLRDLADRGIRLGIVTNLPKWLYAPMLTSHGDALPFETAVGWSDSRRKPNPDSLELAMKRLEIDPTPQDWYVGDTDSDAQAALAAGMSFAWAAWGYGPTCPNGASRCLEMPEEIAELG